MEQNKSLKGWLLMGAAFLFCPCHLVFLVPLLAGTALGGILSRYWGITSGVLAAIFVVLLWLGFKFLNQEKRG
ncbi:hypothetical protein [Effusibacillus pohliae]|uniref:hypothetical protein n=1 Tax=Effusibacillus pohliae TaxID=232270 RepID=UPI000374AADC|nr:hypothetical protein [Effusibacillus pohliae]